MKPESLQVSGPQVLTPTSSDDFVTQVFHHPEIAALCPNGNPSPRVKAIVLIAGQVKEEQLYERQRRAAPERLFKLAFLQRMFGGAPTVVMQPAPDIVEAILAGRQPQELTFDKLCQDIPLRWVEQREQFGFSPANTGRPRSLV